MVDTISAADECHLRASVLDPPFLGFYFYRNRILHREVERDEVKIIQPSCEILDPKGYVSGTIKLRIIEEAARTSHLSESGQTLDSWQPFIKAVVAAKGDWSVAEHQTAQVKWKIPRGLTHEIVRHRHFSYTQSSTRFVNYAQKDQKTGELKREMEFVEPIWPHGNTHQPRIIWERAMFDAEQAYLELIENGQKPEIARGVLPNDLAATLVMTGNLRAWRWFLMMRTTKETVSELRRLTLPLLREFQERIPILYDDILGEEKQSISLSRPS